MSSSSQNPEPVSTRGELIEIITRDSISAGGDEVWATDLVDAYRGEIERDVRWQIAKDFEEFGKTHDTFSWGQAVYIARDGLCSCSGGSKPCDMGGAS